MLNVFPRTPRHAFTFLALNTPYAAGPNSRRSVRSKLRLGMINTMGDEGHTYALC